MKAVKEASVKERWRNEDENVNEGELCVLGLCVGLAALCGFDDRKLYIYRKHLFFSYICFFFFLNRLQFVLSLPFPLYFDALSVVVCLSPFFKTH